jgi:hypothetical protein
MLNLVDPSLKNGTVMASECIAKAERKTTEPNDIRARHGQPVQQGLLLVSYLISWTSGQNCRMFGCDAFRCVQLA